MSGVAFYDLPHPRPPSPSFKPVTPVDWSASAIPPTENTPLLSHSLSVAIKSSR